MSKYSKYIHTTIAGLKTFEKFGVAYDRLKITENKKS